MRINCIFRFSNSLLILILSTAIGIATGLVLSNPPDRIMYIPQTQTCIFPDFAEREVHFVSVAGYAILVFVQGTAIF